MLAEGFLVGFGLEWLVNKIDRNSRTRSRAFKTGIFTPSQGQEAGGDLDIAPGCFEVFLFQDLSPLFGFRDSHDPAEEGGFFGCSSFEYPGIHK